MWTEFWDMHSGGGLKDKWPRIYIEASEEEAKIIFYNRFGHNPDRVSCTCCGADYNIKSNESLAQLTGFHRNCRCLNTPRGEDGLYMNDDPVIVAHMYLEKGEKPPKGYTVEKRFMSAGKYMTLNEYMKSKDTHFIHDQEIKSEERVGEVPEQGYVWIG
jgi:UDP-N-acetylmuramate-alanine ligase